MEFDFEALINLAGLDGHSSLMQYKGIAEHENWFRFSSLRELLGCPTPTPPPFLEPQSRLCYRGELNSPTT